MGGGGDMGDMEKKLFSVRLYLESKWGLSGLGPLIEPIKPNHTSEHASAPVP